MTSSRIPELEDVFFPARDSVFDVNGLDPVLNVFRTAVISSYRGAELFELISVYRNSPLLVTEILGRLLVIQCPIQKFGKSHYLIMILQNALMPQQVELEEHSQEVRAARNVSFQFLLVLAKLEDNDLLSEQPICYAFLGFAFELDLAPLVFAMIQAVAGNIRCFDHIVSFVDQIAWNCVLDRKWLPLTELTARSLVSIIRHRPDVGHLFHGFLDSFLSICDPGCVDSLLALVDLVTADCPRYELTPHHLISVVQVTARRFRFSKSSSRSLSVTCSRSRGSTSS
jgi:hypothetical protein